MPDMGPRFMDTQEFQGDDLEVCGPTDVKKAGFTQVVVTRVVIYDNNGGSGLDYTFPTEISAPPGEKDEWEGIVPDARRRLTPGDGAGVAFGFRVDANGRHPHCWGGTFVLR